MMLDLKCLCVSSSQSGCVGERAWGFGVGVGGRHSPVLTPHLLRAMYHHLSRTERKLRPPTQLRTSSSPSPST